MLLDERSDEENREVAQNDHTDEPICPDSTRRWDAVAGIIGQNARKVGKCMQPWSFRKYRVGQTETATQAEEYQEDQPAPVAGINLA